MNAPVAEGLSRETARAYYRNARPEMLRFLPGHCARVLEVGCGEGIFSAQLGPGIETWGVELDGRAARAAAERLHQVMVGTYEQCEDRLPAGYFDLVVCNDVIEHMSDHRRFLESISGKLAPGGCLVGSIPNVRHVRNLYELLVQKDWRYREAGILDATHLRFFTEKSLRRALEESGFVVETLAGINDSRDFVHDLLVRAIGVVTLGYYSDVRYLQFGFRARKAA